MKVLNSFPHDSAFLLICMYLCGNRLILSPNLYSWTTMIHLSGAPGPYPRVQGMQHTSPKSAKRSTSQDGPKFGFL